MIPSFVESLSYGEQALQAQASLRLETIFTYGFGTPDFLRALAQRESLLGSATLTNESLLLLCTLLQPQVSDISAHLVWHAATQSASETQAVLPPHVAVLKTVTVQLHDVLVLLTGVGDFHLHRTQRRTLAKQLALPRSVHTHTTINPDSLDPQHMYGLLEGMVSPFIPGHRSTRLSAIACMPPPASSEYTSFAISLSRYESLLVPLTLFPTLLHHYRSIVYPQLLLIELS